MKPSEVCKIAAERYLMLEVKDCFKAVHETIAVTLVVNADESAETKASIQYVLKLIEKSTAPHGGLREWLAGSAGVWLLKRPPSKFVRTGCDHGPFSLFLELQKHRKSWLLHLSEELAADGN